MAKKEQLQKLKGKLMQHSKNAEDLIIFSLYFVDTHPQKDGLDFATVLSFLLLCTGIKDIFGRNTCIRNALPVTYHPYENIRNAVLRLQLRKKVRIKHEMTKVTQVQQTASFVNGKHYVVDLTSSARKRSFVRKF